MKLFSYLFILIISYFFISSKSYAFNNCSTCGASSGFGKELGRVIPSDPYFHARRIVLSCTENNGRRWNNTLLAYMNTNYVYAIQDVKDQAILIIGHRIEGTNKIKLKGIKKWLPTNHIDYYFFVRLEKKFC